MEKLSISIEQKAKAYDEALKKAKDMLSYKEVRREDMEYLFPELKESEDERIRKAIIATIHLYYGEPLEDEAKEMLAWLERQKPSDAALEYLKENHSPSEVSDFQAAMNIAVAKAYDRGRADAIEEMQNLAWNEEDEEFLRRAINATKDAYPITAKWLKSLKSRVQSKQEWNEEDDLILETIIDHIIPDKPFIANGFTDEELVTWLKSLKDRVQSTSFVYEIL